LLTPKPYNSTCHLALKVRESPNLKLTTKAHLLQDPGCYVLVTPPQQHALHLRVIDIVNSNWNFLWGKEPQHMRLQWEG
jgi:hypothetical protein